MATLYVTECADFANWGTGDRVRVLGLPPIESQTLTIAAASAASAAFQPGTRVIRVVSDTPCAIAAGENPTATVEDLFLPANSPEYFAVSSGDKIAVIEVTAP